MWVDTDKRPYAEKPEEYYSSFLWDGADQMAFRPFARFWKVDPGGEAVNVNSMDEVPDSAWFTNRIGKAPLTLEQARRGPCSGPLLDPTTTWTVTGAKPNGANPGFPIKAADGRRYMVKFDGVVQGPRATAADTIVSKFYHVAGFSTPCNEVVFFDRSILKIADDAESENAAGEKIKMTEKDLDVIFSKAIRLPDGRYRSSVSLYLKGRPIGPFRYQGTRDDDPNDIIRHDDRRELRASYVLAGWTNHFDSREQNTLDMWVEQPAAGVEGAGYVQHSILDFGDCFGSVWEPPMLGRRIGHSHYFAGDHVFVDWLTLGFTTRPWDSNRFGKTKAVLGYYQVDNFEPDSWRPGYPNPAMLRMTERDGAWMARILARMTPAHVSAMLEAGKIQDPLIKEELHRVVQGRRMKTLRRYLSRLSPLTEPEVRGSQLCMEDLGVTAGVFAASQRTYTARAWAGSEHPKAIAAALATDASASPEVCAALPNVAASSAQDPAYLIVDLVAQSGSQPRVPARVHLYQLGSSYRVVGLERPDDNDAPG